jgi:hypothetical protein
MLYLLVFNRGYRLEIQSVMLVVSTPLVNYIPSTFSPVHLPDSEPTRLLHHPKQKPRKEGGLR